MTGMALGEAAVGGGLLGVGGALGVAGLKLVEAMLARRRTPEQKLGEAATAASDLIKLALEASGTSVEQLLTRLETLQQEQADLRREHDALKHSHAACETRCEALTSDLRQANAKIDALGRQLKNPAATAPGGPLHGALIELAGGEVTVTTPAALALPTGEK